MKKVLTRFAAVEEISFFSRRFKRSARRIELTGLEKKWAEVTSENKVIYKNVSMLLLLA